MKTAIIICLLLNSYKCSIFNGHIKNDEHKTPVNKTNRLSGTKQCYIHGISFKNNTTCSIKNRKDLIAWEETDSECSSKNSSMVADNNIRNGLICNKKRCSSEHTHLYNIKPNKINKSEDRPSKKGYLNGMRWMNIHSLYKRIIMNEEDQLNAASPTSILGTLTEDQLDIKNLYDYSCFKGILSLIKCFSHSIEELKNTEIDDEQYTSKKLHSPDHTSEQTSSKQVIVNKAIISNRHKYLRLLEMCVQDYVFDLYLIDAICNGLFDYLFSAKTKYRMFEMCELYTSPLHPSANSTAFKDDLKSLALNFEEVCNKAIHLYILIGSELSKLHGKCPAISEKPANESADQVNPATPDGQCKDDARSNDTHSNDAKNAILQDTIDDLYITVHDITASMRKYFLDKLQPKLMVIDHLLSHSTHNTSVLYQECPICRLIDTHILEKKEDIASLHPISKCSAVHARQKVYDLTERVKKTKNKFSTHLINIENVLRQNRP